MTFIFRSLFLTLLFSFSNGIAQSSTEIEGVWQMKGYGWIFEIDSKDILTYDITSISCLPSAIYPRAMMADDYSIEGNELTIHIGISTYQLDRLEELPDVCGVTLSRKRKKDPIYNFEVLWNTFNEQYAYFDLRGVDWDTIYKKYRSQVTVKTKPVNLYGICAAMLAELKDGHVDLDAPDKIMDVAEEESGDDINFKEVHKAIAAHYVKEIKVHNFTRSMWGKINDRVGYLQVNSMSTQSHYGITSSTTLEEAHKLYTFGVENSQNPMGDEVTGMNKTMHKVFEDIKDVDYLILDVRFNGGGYDAVSYEILRFLIDQNYTVFKKHARLGNETTQPYLYELEPEGTYFDGKVYILQSAFSGSATETMLLASMQLPNVTRVGIPSEGILSDALEKVMPNGWSFTLSNEAYLTPDGVNYEHKGIPVNHKIDYSRDASTFNKTLENDLKTGDKAIEWVLKQVD